jgi:hypothetical protein
MRASVVSQTEYPTMMQAFFGQLTGGSFRVVNMFTTAAFLGGRPATWELTIPDFTGTTYQNTWGLQSGASVNVNVQGFDGDAAVILGAAPEDGDTFRSALRDATATAIQASALRASSQPIYRKQGMLLRRRSH